VLSHCNKRGCSASQVTCLPARWPPVLSRCFSKRHSSGLKHNKNTTGCSSLLETLGSSNKPCNQSASPSAVHPAFVVKTVSWFNIIQNKVCSRREVEENLLSLLLIKLVLVTPCAYVTKSYGYISRNGQAPARPLSLFPRNLAHPSSARNRARVVSSLGPRFLPRSRNCSGRQRELVHVAARSQQLLDWLETWNMQRM
jgi:hypothetical protein